MDRDALDRKSASTVANVIIDEQRETIAILRAEVERSRRLLDAIRVVDLQVLPEHIAKLVAEWKTS